MVLEGFKGFIQKKVDEFKETEGIKLARSRAERQAYDEIYHAERIKAMELKAKKKARADIFAPSLPEKIFLGFQKLQKNQEKRWKQ